MRIVLVVLLLAAALAAVDANGSSKQGKQGQQNQNQNQQSHSQQGKHNQQQNQQNQNKQDKDDKQGKQDRTADFFGQNKGFEMGINWHGTFGTLKKVNDKSFQSNSDYLGILYNIDRETKPWASAKQIAGDFIGPGGNQWCLDVVIDDPQLPSPPVLCNSASNKDPLIYPTKPLQGKKQKNGDLVAVWKGEVPCLCLRCKDGKGKSLPASSCKTCTSSKSYECTHYFAAEVQHTFVAEETRGGSGSEPPAGNKISIETIVKNTGNVAWKAYYVIRWINADPCGTAKDADTAYSVDFVAVDRQRDGHRLFTYDRNEEYQRYGSAFAQCKLKGQQAKFIQVAHYSEAEAAPSEQRRRRGRREECDWFFDPFCDPFDDSSWDSGTTCEANCQGGDSNNNYYDSECWSCERARRSGKSQSKEKKTKTFPILAWVRGVHSESLVHDPDIVAAYEAQQKKLPKRIPLPAGHSFKQVSFLFFEKPEVDTAEARTQTVTSTVGESNAGSLCCKKPAEVVQELTSVVGGQLKTTFKCAKGCEAGAEPAVSTTSECHNTCRPCATGYYQPDAEQAACLPCLAGTYQDEEGQQLCKLCPAGTYQDEEGQSLCKPCPAGAYQDEEGSQQCKACLISTYQDEEGSQQCKPCAANKYQDEEGQTLCKPCPTGFARQSGSSNVYCTECIPPASVGKTGTCAKPGVVLSMPSPAPACVSFKATAVALPLLPQTHGGSLAWVVSGDALVGQASKSATATKTALAKAKAVYKIDVPGKWKLYIACKDAVFLSSLSGAAMEDAQVQLKCDSKGKFVLVGEFTSRTLVVAPASGKSELLGFMLTSSKSSSTPSKCDATMDETPVANPPLGLASSFEHDGADINVHGVLTFVDVSDTTATETQGSKPKTFKGAGRAFYAHLGDLPVVSSGTGPFHPATGAQFLVLDKRAVQLQSTTAVPGPTSVGDATALSNAIQAAGTCTRLTFKWLAPVSHDWDSCPKQAPKGCGSAPPAVGDIYPDRLVVHKVGGSGGAKLIAVVEANEVRSAGSDAWSTKSVTFSTTPSESFRIEFGLNVTADAEDIWLDDVHVVACH